MKPVYQTRHGEPDGNCFAACVASILERNIEDVDVDVASCNHHLPTLLAKVEQKANCRIYFASHEAITDRILKTVERYCFVEVCTCEIGRNPYGAESTWHVVVCEIADDGRISLLHNPDQQDQRQKSLQQFPAVGKVFFVTANSKT